MDKLRILMLCCEFPPVGGGASQVVHGLAHELARQGHQVDVLTMRWRHRGRPVARVHVTEVPCIRLHKHRTSVWELLLYLGPLTVWAAVQLRRHRYDICHAHFILPDGVVAALLSWWGGRRLVITAHGSDVPGYNPDRFRLLHRLLQPAWRRIVGSAKAVVCPSPTLERLVKARLPAAPTVVVPNGFDTARFVTGRPRARRILVVSRLLARKRVDQVIAAYQRLDTDFELHIVGDGPALADLRTLAAKDVRPIRLWGWLDNDDPHLRDLYETSAVFVLMSAAENFPVSLLEAMAAGLAIVTSRGTGCAEVVGDTALLVEPGDLEGLSAALGRLIEDDGLRQRLGQAARRRLETRFGWLAIANRYVDLYRTCGRADGGAPCRPMVSSLPW